MSIGNQDKVQLIIRMSRELYEMDGNDKEIWLLIRPSSPFTLELDTECFYKSLEYYNCTKEQIIQIMNLDEVEIIEVLKKSGVLPINISKKLGHTNMILKLGIDAFGNLDDFLIWMNTPNELFNDKKPVDSLKEVEMIWEGGVDEEPNEEDYFESDVYYIELIHIIAGI